MLKLKSVDHILENVESGEIWDYTLELAEQKGMQESILIRVPERGWLPEWKLCEQFLMDALSAGPLPCTDVQDAALMAGFSSSTIRQVKERTGIRSEWHGTVTESGRWWWSWPDGDD